MMIRLTRGADADSVKAALSALGVWATTLTNEHGTTALSVSGHSAEVGAANLARVPGVAEVLSAPSPHPLVDGQAGTPVWIDDIPIGGDESPVLMAGPCSVEGPDQIMQAAALAVASGATFLRGGAFKPRTSPYAFSGHGRPALGWLRQAADAHWLKVVTEVMSEAEVEAVAGLADLIQIGSRNMQNFALLRAVGASGKPVLLKRGMSATVSDWLSAGEHLLSAGARGVVFCERGIQSFDSTTRNMLDLGTVALMRHVYRLPVIVDPSHAVGRRDLVHHVSRAALAGGAHGLLVEVHPDAQQARSDGPQALDEVGLKRMGQELFHG